MKEIEWLERAMRKGVADEREPQGGGWRRPGYEAAGARSSSLKIPFPCPLYLLDKANGSSSNSRLAVLHSMSSSQ